MSKRKGTKKKKEGGGGGDVPEMDLDIGAEWEVPKRVLKDQPADYLAIREKGPHYAIEPDATMENIPLAKTGVSSSKPTTVCAVFKKAVERNADTAALRWEEKSGDAFEWHQYTWREYYDECFKAARSFMHLGVEQFDSVNIIGFNSQHWFIANVAAIMCGGKAAGIYTTNQTDACKYISEHSGAKVVVVENEAQLNKFLPIREELEKLSAIVMYRGAVPEGVNDGKSSVTVYDWESFMALHEKTPADDVERRMAVQKPGQCCTLIYTSGTTGNPKAVMMSNDNLTFTSKVVFETMGPEFGTVEEHVVSYLPLSHVAAQMVDIHVPMSIAAVRGGKMTVHFARPDALKGTLKLTLCAARPTFFFGVPRVWEKFAEAIKAIGAKSGGLKKSIAGFAKAKNLYAYEQDQYGASHVKPWFYGVSHAIVSKIHKALGLDRCKVCLTGAAPIQRETLNYFGSLGLRVMELYGMSESSGPETVSTPDVYKIGSCGPVMPGVELRIDHDADRDKEGEGEICFRGRHIMMGYMNNEEKTKEAIDEDGWLHSGDVGRVDEDGFLYITGRIKELIITAGGENIAPVPMEDAIKEKCPALSNVVMVGDKRKYNVCLVTLRCKEEEDGTFSNELVGASAALSSAKTVEEAREDPKWKEYIQAGLDHANTTVAVSNASKIQKFHILDGDLSVASGELTATLKLKRPVLMRRDDVVAAVDALYGGEKAASGDKKARKSTKKKTADPDAKNEEAKKE